MLDAVKGEPAEAKSAAELAAPLRFVTATSLFDGHDAAINIMRRLLQQAGVERQIRADPFPAPRRANLGVVKRDLAFLFLAINSVNGRSLRRR